MADRIRRRISFANVVALLALFVALGGTVYATGKINGKAVKKASLPGNRLKPDSVGGKQVNEASLGTVPAAGIANRVLTTSDRGPIDISSESFPWLRPIPPGSWVVLAKFWVTHTQPGDAHVTCNINSGLFDDFSAVSLGPAGSGDDQASIALEYAFTEPRLSSMVVLVCDTDDPGSVEARDVKVTAIGAANLSHVAG
jgi:hypothetical protein